MTNPISPPFSTACPAAEEIYLYATGASSEEQAANLETHLLACSDCETLLDSLDDPSDALIQALATLPLSPDDEPAYQELRATALASPSAFVEDAQAAAQFRRVARLADPALEPLPCQLGSYELLACIGRGASGAVYRARHLKLGQTVAVKVLDASRSFAADAFLQEMKTIGSLAHPHIVRATDAGEADGLHFLVMEYVDGIDAARLLFRNGPLRVADACEIARQAALGLQFVHERSLVHRDIKPSNLLVTAEGQVKLLDLGIALRSDVNDSDTNDNEEHQTKEKPQGTSDYMAPEQWTHPTAVDPRADLYSLGCTLHRLLTGNLPPKPYVAGSELSSDVPRSVERLLQQLLAPAPDDRPHSVAVVIESLRPHVRGANLQGLIATACPNLTTPAPATQVRSRPITRRQAAIAAIASASAATLLFSRFRFDKSPQLQKSQWRALEPVAPELLLTLDQQNQPTWQFEEDAKLRVSSESLTLVHLGRPVSGLFKLEVDLLQQNWQGGGVFFQWRYDSTVEVPFFRFQSVELVTRNSSLESPTQDRLLWSQWTAKRMGGEILTQQTALAEIAVELSANSPGQRLQVVCGRQGMPEITWNGRQLHESMWQLSLEARNHQRLSAGQLPTAFLGRLGLLNTQGSTTFIQPRLAYL
ncbi:MAG: protein kinase [Planctomycetes bacterium]|nr:protein kinase [Planctomycetota bacterium]